MTTRSAASSGNNMRSQFICVEIALHTDDESPEWIAWFHEQDNHVVKTAGTDAKWFIYFAPLSTGNADSTIRALCTEIDRLPDRVKASWHDAQRRQFFIGYHAGTEWPCLDDCLSHDTLKRVVELKAELRLAIYPADAE